MNTPNSAVQQLTTGGQTLFTVPSGEKYVVRHIRITNQGVANIVGATAGGGIYGSGAAFINAPLTAALTSGGMYDWYGAMVFLAGENLSAITNTGTATIVADYQRYIL